MRQNGSERPQNHETKNFIKCAVGLILLPPFALLCFALIRHLSILFSRDVTFTKISIWTVTALPLIPTLLWILWIVIAFNTRLLAHFYIYLFIGTLP